MSEPTHFDLGSGHYIRWQDSPRKDGQLDLGWNHPCIRYVPDDYWGRVDVSTGTKHVITQGGTPRIGRRSYEHR